MNKKQPKAVLFFLVSIAIVSLFVNISTVRTINDMTEKQNYSLYKIYNEATFKLTEGLNILRDKPTKPSLHDSYNAINTAHSLLDSCQYLNKDFKISILYLQEYLRILSVQNDFQPEYDLAKLEEIVSIYEKITENEWLAPELSEGYSIGSVPEITFQEELVDSLRKIEEISEAALDYHLKR